MEAPYSEPAEVLSAQADKHIIPVSGKDSLCTALVQTALHPDLEYTFVFSDVGSELPETYEWLNRIEAALGWTITRIGRSLPEYIAEYDLIPSARRRFCTKECKIRPMERWMRSAEADHTTVYYGLRADEGDRPGPVNGPGVTAAFPLRRLGFGLRDVWAHLGRESERRGVDLMPPAYDWPALRDAVRFRLGDDYSEGLEPWQERELFAGRSRSNCYFCFFQRLYEWAWLLDVHPDLYEESQRIETETGALLNTPFTWNSRWPLATLRAERDRLLDERADVIAKRIGSLRQRNLFVGDDTPPELARVSCGLLCGK